MKQKPPPEPRPFITPQEKKEIQRLAEGLEKITAAVRDLQSRAGLLREPANQADVPPEPERMKGTDTSRKFFGSRGKLSGTADQALLDLFETERKARGVSLSRMIDIVLWTYFERPPLSFERSESSEE